MYQTLNYIGAIIRTTFDLTDTYILTSILYTEINSEELSELLRKKFKMF